jgi:hypothetical protein
MADSPKRDAAASLTARLAPDPKNPPDLTLLQGWLGASSEDGHKRLYLDPELSNSVEIPEDAIVHTQDIPSDTSPLGGQWVWIKAEAAVKQGPGLERQYARFLRGQIQQDYFAGGGAGAGTVGAPPAVTGPPCGPIRTIFNCPTQQTWCRPSRLTICASAYVICRPPVLATFVCPSVVDGCPSAPGGCDPYTRVQFQTDPILQQAGGFAGVAGGGLGFDPGVAAGGMVGGPNPAAAIAYPRSIIAACQSLFTLCRPSVLTICFTRSPLICQVSAAVICPTRGFCPSAVDGCPSTPGGCDPYTIVQFQTDPVLQQAGGFAGVAGGGLGFDPGVAAGGLAGGMVGGPSPLAAGYVTSPIICQLQTQNIIQCRPTFAVTCRPSVLTICASSPVICRPTIGFACVPSVAVLCPTRGFCPSAVDACPSAPGGCDPYTIVQFPTETIAQQPGGFGGVAGGGLGFDPGVAAGGGMVGAPSPLTAQYATSPAVCQLQTRTLICRPTLIYLQCHTQLPLQCFTQSPVQCFTHVPQQCFTHVPQQCPPITLPPGCPSGFVCGGGGGYPGGGGGF